MILKIYKIIKDILTIEDNNYIESQTYKQILHDLLIATNELFNDNIKLLYTLIDQFCKNNSINEDKKLSTYNNEGRKLLTYNNEGRKLLPNQCDNISVKDKEIIDILDMSKMIEVYNKIINTKNYFKSIEYANLYNNDILLTDDDLLTFYNLRYNEPSDNIFISPSPMVTNLTNKYDGQLSPDIQNFIKSRQYDVLDKVYTAEPDIFISEILSLSDTYQSFATLFYLEYYLKRMIQNGITEFTLNYNVCYDNVLNKYSVVRGNELYNRFILRNVSLIKKFINDKFSDDNLLNTINMNEQAKIYFKNNKIEIDIISKGGNLIKFLLNKHLTKNDGYILTDFTEYLTSLSDWDFNIKFNIHTPLEKIDIINNNNICDTEYGLIQQKIKKETVKYICEYFTNIKELYTQTYNDYDDIEDILKNHILYINQLIGTYSLTMSLSVIQKHIDVKFAYPDINFQDSNQYIDKLLCNMEDPNTHNILHSAKPNAINHNNIFSYISQGFIGQSNEYFDLTRLCIRLEITGCLLKAKVECIDFGLDIPYSLNYNSFNLSSPDDKYTWIVKSGIFSYKGKNIVYLICELVKLIFEQSSKRIKRLIRLFELLEYAIKNNNSIFELTHVSCKYLENKFMNTRLNLNIIDAIIFMFIEYNKLINSNNNKLMNIGVFIEFKNSYNLFVDKLVRNQQNEMNDKVIFTYFPNNIGAFPFSGYLKISDYSNILANYNQYLYPPYIPTRI